MTKWNGKRFSIYTSDEENVLNLIEELGVQTNHNTERVETIIENDKEKVTHKDINETYKIDKTGNFTGSWFGLTKPTLTDEGLKATVEELKDKIPSIETSLEHKANKNEIFTMSNMGQDVREAMTGGSVAVVGKNAVLSENILDGQVREVTTSFIKPTSANMFDKDYFTVGTIVGDTGAYDSLSGHGCTDYIPVVPNETYTVSKILPIPGGAYDLNKNWVGKATPNTTHTENYTFTVPSNVYYIRLNISITLLDTFVMCKGTEIIPYVESDYIIAPKIKILKSQIKDYQVNKNDLEFLNYVSNNLYVKETVTPNIINSIGSIVTNDGYVHTDLIDVNGFTNVTVTTAYSSAGVAYDSNMNIVSSSISGLTCSKETSPYTFTLHPSVKYIRLNLSTKKQDSFVIVKGKTISPIIPQTPYYKLTSDVKIGNDNLVDLSIDVKTKDKKIWFFGDSITAGGKWVNPFVELSKVSYSKNFGISGATWTYKTNLNDAPHHVQSAISQYDNATVDKPDLIILSYGTNDSTSVFTVEDSVIESKFTSGIDYIPLTTDLTTLIDVPSAMRWCVETLLAKFPNAQIFICTPIQRVPTTFNYTSQRLKRDSIIKVSDRLSVNLIDTFNCGIYSRFEVSGAQGKYLYDGLHPDENGGLLMAKFNFNEVDKKVL